MDTKLLKKISDKDHETRAREDDHHSLKLWLRLLSCTQLIENNIRELLRTESEFTLPRFDLLSQLYRHPEGLIMGDLAKMMMVSGGNVTSIVKQLERDDMIKRVAQSSDNRSFLVTLTTKGRDRFSKIAPLHESWVIQLMDGLTDKDMDQVMKKLDKLKNHIKSLG